MSEPSRMRLMGLDYGRKRIGVATCDAMGIVVTPVGHVDRQTDKQAALIVAELAKREQVEGIVIGLPLHAGGAEGGNVQWVRNFIKELQAVCVLPVHEVDERYSSSEAEEALRAEGNWPAPPGRVDARAAAIVLRRFLNGET